MWSMKIWYNCVQDAWICPASRTAVEKRIQTDVYLDNGIALASWCIFRQWHQHPNIAIIICYCAWWSHIMHVYMWVSQASCAIMILTIMLGQCAVWLHPVLAQSCMHVMDKHTNPHWYCIVMQVHTHTHKHNTRMRTHFSACLSHTCLPQAGRGAHVRTTGV